MNFELNNEQLMIRDTARQFAESEIAPVAEQLESGGNRELLLETLAKLAELGFMGLNIDADYDGVEAGTVAFSVAITELARASSSVAVTVSVSNMVAEVIQAVGSESQRRQYLPKLCSGQYPAGAFCLTESGAGSDPKSMKTRAERDGDDWVLNGSKLFITSGEIAGLMVVWAVTDSNVDPAKGISCFVVEADNPGVVIGPAEKKMGQSGSPTNEVYFENCRIPSSALLGEENNGFSLAMCELAGGRIGIGSLALGIGRAAMDYARGYLLERKQFGKHLADFQGLQWMLADRYTELQAAELMLLKAAWMKEQGMAFGSQASMAKLFATEKANDACYSALQMLGGIGYTRECPVERWTRDVRVTTIYEGSSEVQRLIIARHLLAEAKQYV